MKNVAATLVVVRFRSRTVICHGSVIGACLQEDFRLISCAMFMLSPSGAAEQRSRGLVNSERKQENDLIRNKHCGQAAVNFLLQS